MTDAANNPKAFFSDPRPSFAVELCKALGLRTRGLVSFRLSAGEDGTPFTRIHAEYVEVREFGEAAEKVARDFLLVPTARKKAATASSRPKG